MRGVAARLGVSATALYQYFEGKASLLRAIRLYGLTQLNDQLTSAGKEQATTEQIRKLLTTYLSFALSNPTLYTLVFQPVSYLITIGDATDEEISARHFFIARVAQSLHAEKNTGQVSVSFDKELAGAVTWGAAHGLAMLLIGGEFQKGSEDELINCFLESESSRWARFLEASPSQTFYDRSKRMDHKEVRVFLVTDGAPPDPDIEELITSLVVELAENFDLELIENLPSIVGSWLKRFVFKAKGTLSSDEVKRRIEALEDGIRAHGIDMPKSESTAKYAEAIERIMNSVGKNASTERVAFLMDTLLVVKFPGPDGTPVVICKQLSRTEQDALNANHELMVDPEKLLFGLKEVVSGQLPSPTSAAGKKLGAPAKRQVDEETV